MKFKKYTLEDMKINHYRTCDFCEGTRVVDMDGEIQECPICEGTGKIEIDLRECHECGTVLDNNDMVWVSDRYGIPYKKVCPDCEEKVAREIGSWEFDPEACGETLEPEDYY